MVGTGDSTNTTTEIYDTATGGWAFTGSLNTVRISHTATLLPRGQVLVAGGANVPAAVSAELYDPATGLWSYTGPLNEDRNSHTATLLPDGRVLAAGGISGGPMIPNSAELYDQPLGFAPAWRPQITSFPSKLRAGAELVLGGSGFSGISEASGGSTNNSPTDYPLVQLRRLDNEMALWLSPDPAHPFSATAFTSGLLPALPAGHYLLTVYANAIPSVPQISLAPAPNSGGITGPLFLLLLDD